jgi:hypothetical protein
MELIDDSSTHKVEKDIRYCNAFPSSRGRVLRAVINHTRDPNKEHKYDLLFIAFFMMTNVPSHPSEPQAQGSPVPNGEPTREPGTEREPTASSPAPVHPMDLDLSEVSVAFQDAGSTMINQTLSQGVHDLSFTPTKATPGVRTKQR